MGTHIYRQKSNQYYLHTSSPLQMQEVWSFKNKSKMENIKTEASEVLHVAITKMMQIGDITKEFKREDISDGYHSFKELYEFRKIYNAVLFNEWAKQGKFEVHKSKKHHDGEDCFGGGWFIVVAVLPTGQISNHYELKDWALFQCEETETAKYVFDGHTSQDVLQRLGCL